MSTVAAGGNAGLVTPPGVQTVGPDVFCVDDICQVCLRTKATAMLVAVYATAFAGTSTASEGDPWPR